MTEIKRGSLATSDVSSTSYIEFLADAKFLASVGEFIRRNAEIAGFSPHEANSIELAIDEMVSNAISHGYENKPEGKVKITLGLSDESMTIILEESGKYFNPAEVQEPDKNAPLEERKIGGLGLFIVRDIMDEVYFDIIDEKIKRFTLIKKLKK